MEGADFLLPPVRVLDLTAGLYALCGRILGDLGADVVRVEPPEGDPARRMGPFYGDVPHPDRSLTYWFYNLNKRGITLNLFCEDGRDLFLRLVERADAVVESFPPGTLESLGLGYDRLARVNPRLVLTRITGFGQTGPYARYEAPDLVLQAMGGLMFVTGDPDRPPLRISFPQAHLHGAAEGAVGTLLALYHSLQTGEGQEVDVSAQQGVIWSLMNATVAWDLNRVNIPRLGPYRMAGPGTRGRINWPCRDGYVCFALIRAVDLQRLAEWMDEEGMCPDWLKAYDFQNVIPVLLPQAELDLLSEPIGAFFRRHTKEELFREALRRDIILYPVSTVADLAENPHLRERGFFVEVEHPELGAVVRYPGPPWVVDGERVPVRRRPPLLGEHNAEVYGELGLGREDLEHLYRIGAI